MSDGDDDGFVDDPRGNAFQYLGFMKDQVGDTYRYRKNEENYYYTFKTPVTAKLRKKKCTARNVEARMVDGLLVDIKKEPHPVTQVYNTYAKYLLLKKIKDDDRSKEQYLKECLDAARDEILTNEQLCDVLWRYLR